MDRMQLLDTLLERETQRRDAAVAELRDAQAAAAQAHQQSDALLVYRDEYRQRWQAQFQQRATMDILRCYHGFVERLDQAINAQRGIIELADRRVNGARDRLRQRETRVAMVRKLMERRRQGQALQQDRRDQKAADETAQRMGWAARQVAAAV
jgi:flagellar FliJ protein